MFSRLIITASIALFFTPAAIIFAQEHPEHPKKSAEQPKQGTEHPKKGAEAKQVSTAEISAGIKKNIDAQSKKSSDGKFHVKYEGQDLALDLIRVHDDRLSDLGGGKYFACVDMKATDGKSYDIDFFLAGQPGKMKVTETSVHKIDGKPLYDWKEREWQVAQSAGRLVLGMAPKRSMRLSILAIFFLASVLATRAADNPGIIKGTDQFEFVYRVRLPQIKGEARVWIPLAKTDAFQTVTEEKLNIPVKWERVQDRDYGNDICVLYPQSSDSGKTVEVRYRVTRKEKASYSANSAEAARYLRPEMLVPVNETFRTLAQKAAAGKTDDFERAKALYDHVIGRMRYDKSGTGWGRGDAMYACDVHTGNCTDFHAYFIALTRSIDIPARFAIGATIPADKNEGTIDGYHCWAEFLAGGRWVPVDISEAWKNPKLADYYFGHNPANRFELTKGRDLVVDPEPASGPINFLAYPLFEMNGELIKPETTFIFRRIGA